MGPRSCLGWFRKSTTHTMIKSPNCPGRSESLYSCHEARGCRYTSTLPSALGHQWLTHSCQINSRKEPWYPFIKSWVGPRAIQGVLEERKILVPNRIQTLYQWNRHYSDQTTRLPKFQPTTGHEGLALATLPLGRKHCTHCTGGWVGKRASLTGALYPCHEGIQGK